MANTERVVSLFIELAKINSPSRRERGVADLLKRKLESLGFEVEEDDAGPRIGGDTGNIIAYKKGTAPQARSLFLCCHMDTVEPTEGIRVLADETLIRTDGTTILGADDKAGIAAVIEGIESVVESGAGHGDIQVLFDVAEEIGLLGAKALDTSKIRGELGYVFDTERPVAGITVSAPSHESLLVTVTGRAAHAGIAPEKGINAIVAASRAIAKMNLGRIDHETTANVGVIEGGKARNIVPERVVVKAEARSRSEEKLVRLVDHMQGLFEMEAARMGARAEVEAVREYTGYRFTEDDPVVRLAMRASARIGIEPVLMDGGGGSDANVFNSAGIPTVVVGVGFEGAHSSSEQITVDDLVKAAEFASALVLTAAEG